MVDYQEPPEGARIFCSVCAQLPGAQHSPQCKYRGTVDPRGSSYWAPKHAEDRAHELLRAHLTEGVKADDGKPRMDLLDPVAMAALSQVLTFGAAKYAAHNWRKGIKQSRLIAALLRHVFAHLKGEDNDPESGLPHIAHAMCCCMFLLGLAGRAELDDRENS